MRAWDAALPCLGAQHASEMPGHVGLGRSPATPWAPSTLSSDAAHLRSLATKPPCLYFRAQPRPHSQIRGRMARGLPPWACASALFTDQADACIQSCLISPTRSTLPGRARGAAQGGRGSLPRKYDGALCRGGPHRADECAGGCCRLSTARGGACQTSVCAGDCSLFATCVCVCVCVCVCARAQTSNSGAN